MRVDRRVLNWGVFLVAVGAVPLAAREGLIPGGISWGDLWPLIVIGAGLGLLLRATPAAGAGGLLIALTFGLIIGGAITGTGDLGFSSLSCGSSGRSFPTAGGTFDAQAVSVDLSPACGSLDVTVGDPTAWSVSGTSGDGQPPPIDAGSDRLSVRGSPNGLFNVFGDGGAFAVRLPSQPTIDLSTTVNAGHATLALGRARVTGLDLTVNAGQAIVDLGAGAAAHLSTTVNAGSARITLPAGGADGSATVNAGELLLCAPAGMAVRIETSGALGSYDLAGSGLVQSGSTWQTPGFDAATTRIDLSTTANAGRIALNPAEGCR